MKTIAAFPVPALSHKPKVKKFLIRGIIYLTSDKFSTFASVIACLISFIGLLVDNDRLMAFGVIVFLMGFSPWAIRQTLRDIRQNRLVLNNDKW